MKVLIIKSGKTDFRNPIWNVLIILGSILCLPDFCLSQTSRLNLNNYRHIINDSNLTVRVRTTNNVGIVNQQTSLRDFRVNPNTRSAVFANGRVTRNMESNGKTSEGKKIKGLVLPELYLARAVGMDRPVLFQIFIDTIQPLSYDEKDNKYKGQFSITLVEDSKEVLEGMVLEKPVKVEFSPGSGGVRFLPGSINIDHTNLPSSSINVEDPSPVSPLPILVKTDFKPEGYLTYLTKEQLLRINTPSKSIQGLGVETIPITISLKGKSRNDSVNVTFSIDKGSVDPLNLYISEIKPGTVSLRSEGVGTATLTASANGFLDDQQMFTYKFPWMFILFSLIGGIFGALVKYGMNKARKGLLSTLWLGLITGFIGAILFYVLGIELFTIKISRSLNEFAVLGVSFLIALFWQQVFSGIKNIFLKKS